ncbi:MAG TPA: DNA/RNA helicase domain-containing protein [Burkholderiaceae bacterium]
MIIYQASKARFLHHAFESDIEDVILEHYKASLGGKADKPLFTSWANSLMEMAKVLRDDEIPDDAGIAIEYQLPRSTKRIDFIITGEDDEARPRVVIVELKQWSKSRRSAMDAIVWARRGGKAGETEGPHPSYQAWTYAALLEDFNTEVQRGEIGLRPCAYLHNHLRDGEIDHPHYAEHIARAPLFLKTEQDKLRAFIRKHVRKGDRKQVLYAIERGRIRPSKTLADSVTQMMQGKSEFLMIDDQKLVFEAILAADARAEQRKQVVIVQGGPGTGKSVVAINALGALLARGRNSRFVSKNAAPRAVFKARLTGTFTATRINNLFTGSGAFVDDEPDTFDTLIVDEAHRLNEKGGLYRNRGENQIKELIRASRCCVFFIDDDQRVTFDDIGDTAELRAHAEAQGAEIAQLQLTSQFRCNGSDGYLAWLDNTLDIRATANDCLDISEYDFRVFDDPVEMHRLIDLKNKVSNRARVVAGYCWKWPSKKNSSAWDIELPEYGYRRRWNLTDDGSLWIVKPNSVEQVGCVHTCQGLELDYVGVIIGPDMIYRNGRIITDATRRATSDRSVRGLKKRLKEDRGSTLALADRIVKNTYRTLMTRGMKGCFVYCTDPALADYLRSRLSEAMASPADASAVEQVATNIFPFVRVSPAERAAGAPALPLVDLKIAAGSFSDAQALAEGASEWIVPPDWVRPRPGYFVAQVVGESMNRRIPNGAWVLFKANPQGSRQGKVVVVQHRSIDDPETGGRYTIKVYSSEKAETADGNWEHQRIILSPDSDRPEFQPIVVDAAASAEGELKVIAEFVAVVEP